MCFCMTQLNNLLLYRLLDGIVCVEFLVGRMIETYKYCDAVDRVPLRSNP